MSSIYLRKIFTMIVENVLLNKKYVPPGLQFFTLTICHNEEHIILMQLIFV